MDERTEAAAEALGLPDDAEELFDCIDAVWEDIKTSGFAGKDEEERKRRAFVVLLERIIGAHLEKKVTRVLQEAEKIADDDTDD
jgi:ABC-type Fe3+-hydroxamate transport system substrate-binding protein